MANDIVTRLLMNNAGFVSGARGGQKAMTGLTGTIVAGSRAIMGALAPLTSVFAGIFAARAAIGGAREAIMGEQKLTAVLAATGMAAGLSTKQIQEYAEARMGLTNFDDDATIGAASVLATFKNISGSMFTETLSTAQDLSTVLGTDLTAASMTLGKALNDPATGLSRLTRLGITFTAQQQEQIRTMQEAGDLAGAQAVILEELKNKFGGAAEAVVDPWTQVKNTMGEVAENIGHTVMPSINLLSESLNEMMGGAAGATATFMEMGTIAASVFGNLGTVGQLAWAQIQLGVVRGIETLSHFFYQVIPTAIDWLGKNWGDFWFSAFDLVSTVFINMGENIRNIMAEIWEFIKSGGTDDLEIAWKPLTEGFVSTLKELPDIPDRIIGDLERTLMNDVDNLTTTLADAISTDLVAAQAKRDAVEFAQGMMMDMQDEEGGTEAASKARVETSAGALDARTREAVAAVARATNDARNPATRIAERSLVEQQETNDHLEDIAINLGNLGNLRVAPI